MALISAEMYLFGCETRHWEHYPAKKRRKNERKGFYPQVADANTQSVFDNTGVMYTNTQSPHYSTEREYDSTQPSYSSTDGSYCSTDNPYSSTQDPN